MARDERNLVQVKQTYIGPTLPSFEQIEDGSAFVRPAETPNAVYIKLPREMVAANGTRMGRQSEASTVAYDIINRVLRRFEKDAEVVPVKAEFHFDTERMV